MGEAGQATRDDNAQVIRFCRWVAIQDSHWLGTQRAVIVSQITVRDEYATTRPIGRAAASSQRSANLALPLWTAMNDRIHDLGTRFVGHWYLPL